MTKGKMTLARALKEKERILRRLAKARELFMSVNCVRADEPREMDAKEAYEAMQKFAVDCKKYVKNVVFSVVDVIGEDEIKASQEMADKLGITLRVRKYESGN